MTFKTILQLSIIAFFVVGSFALAEKPRNDATNTTPSTVVSQTNDSNATPTIAPPQTNPNSTIASSSSNEMKPTSQQKTTVGPTPSVENKTVSPSPNVTTVSRAPSRIYSNRTNGYSVQQIRSMPMVARPDRPGHFIGNTVRAFYRGRRGR